MSAIFALAGKDLRLLTRDRAGFFFTFIFPVAFALFFGMIFAGGNKGGMAGSGIKVAVLDSDNTEASRAFAKTLGDAEELKVTVPQSLDEGNLLVVQSKVVALIQIMPGYGEGQQNLFWRGGAASTIEVAVDPSKKAEAGMLQGVLQKYAFAGMGKAFTDPKTSKGQIESVRKKIADSKDMSGADRLMFNTFFNSMDTFMGQLDQRDQKAKDTGTDSTDKKDEAGFAFEPVKIVNRDLSVQRNELPPNSWTISFPQGIIWGVMGAALGFAASLVGEKTGGTFGRLMASPLPRWGVLGGKARRMLHHDDDRHGGDDRRGDGPVRRHDQEPRNAGAGDRLHRSLLRRTHDAHRVDRQD
ncbi:MAG: ABC transporter permease [Phycisphaerales bacterium]